MESGSSNCLWALGGFLVAAVAVGLYVASDFLRTRLKSRRGQESAKYIPMADAESLLEENEI